MSSVDRNIMDLDWITLIMFASLFIITISKYFFKGNFFTFIILPFNNKYLTLNKKKGKMVNGFHILVTAFQVLNMALFIFLARNLFLGQQLNADASFFWLILALLMGFIFVKLLLQMGNGYFFENYSLMTDLIFEKLTYFNYGGGIAFIGNLFLVYILPGYMPLIYAILLLIILVNGIGLVNLLRNHQKLVSSHIFYFILYLCTLEIAPLAIAISFLNG